jgi:hypothetical protein
VTAILPTHPLSCTAPDRLRWIADFLDLADKAISIIACVQGVEYSEQLHTGAQRDLRAWARWLDARPDLAAEMDVARLVLGAKVEDESQMPFHSSLLTTRPSPSAPPSTGEGEDNFNHGLSTHEGGLNVTPQHTTGA